MNKMWWLAAFIIVGILLGIGVLLLVTRPPRGEPIILLPAPTTAPITIYVSGNVNKVGLYTLPVGSRVNDAIQAAGGFSVQANQAAINLAEILEDGEQVYVPAIMPMGAGTIGPSAYMPSDGLVDINSATLEQLESLPEIGPITAQKILDYRLANGRYSTIDDLLEVDGIGQVTFEKIKDLITVGTSP